MSGPLINLSLRSMTVCARKIYLRISLVGNAGLMWAARGCGSILMAQCGVSEEVVVDMTPKYIETCRHWRLQKRIKISLLRVTVISQISVYRWECWHLFLKWSSVPKGALVASCGKSRVLNNGGFCFCMVWEVATGTLRSGSAAVNAFDFGECICLQSMNMRVRRRAE